jgi:hypothetical protein
MVLFHKKLPDGLTLSQEKNTVSAKAMARLFNIGCTAIENNTCWQFYQN